MHANEVWGLVWGAQTHLKVGNEGKVNKHMGACHL